MLTGSRMFFESNKLYDRAARGIRLLENCSLCPRNCGVNRLAGEKGYCATGRQAKIASWGAHFGEEQPLVGQHGSGTIFLASCSLRCCFCQNYEISHRPDDALEATPEQMAAIMLELQQAGCHNINFVTPSHVVPQILESLVIAFESGLTIPLVYNSSGYDAAETINLLAGVIDIYLPDFKFWQPASADKYADAPDYPKIARNGLKIMHRQVGELLVDEHGLAVSGLLIRHLLMPEGLEETRQILEYIAAEISLDSFVNIMDQYRPCGLSSRCQNYPELGRSITAGEWQQALLFAGEAGLTRLDRRDLGSLLRRLGIV